MKQWMPSAEVDAQCCHVGWGFAAAGWCFALGWAWWVVVPIILGWIMVKEYIFDLTVEGDSVKSSTIDAAFYLAGMGAGMLLRWGVT